MKKKRVLIATTILIVAALSVSFAKLKEGEVLTKDNWTKLAGFEPDLSLASFKAGETIDKTNFKKVKAYIPDSLALLIEKYNLKIKLRNYKKIHPSLGYIDATNKYHKQVEIIDTGKEYRKKGIKNYTAGLPFPNPQNGLEVAWNMQYSYNGDDGGFHYGVFWISAKSGVERWEEWQWLYIIRTINRTDIEPLPAIKQFKDKNIQYTSMTWAIEPLDKAGFGALYSRFEDPKDQEGWIYIPTLRREMRATFGTRGDAWNSTDLLYEDVRGYMGYPEWMHWKLVKKTTMLAPLHANVAPGKKARDKTFDFKTWPYWNPNLEWEPRPVYVLEATPKFPDYPYSKMVLYIDAETFYIVFKEAYDKKGELWKLLYNAWNDSPDMTKFPPAIATAVVIDIQAEHATVFPSYNFKSNMGLDPAKFTLTNLRKMGK